VQSFAFFLPCALLSSSPLYDFAFGSPSAMGSSSRRWTVVVVVALLTTVVLGGSSSRQRRLWWWVFHRGQWLRMTQWCAVVAALFCLPCFDDSESSSNSWCFFRQFSISHILLNLNSTSEWFCDIFVFHITVYVLWVYYSFLCIEGGGMNVICFGQFSEMKDGWKRKSM